MLDRLTPPARLAIALAQAEADGSHEVRATPNHLLIGLASTPESAAARLLEDAGLNSRSLDPKGRPYRFAMVVVQEPPEIPTNALADEISQNLQRVEGIADEMNHPLVGAEHLLIALLELADIETRERVESHGVTVAAARATFFGR